MQEKKESAPLSTPHKQSEGNGTYLIRYSSNKFISTERPIGWGGRYYKEESSNTDASFITKGGGFI